MVAGQGCSRHTQKIQTTAIDLGYPQDVTGKSLFLKIPCSSDTGLIGPQNVTNLDDNSSLSASFYDTRMNHEIFQRKEVTNNTNDMCLHEPYQ